MGTYSFQMLGGRAAYINLNNVYEEKDETDAIKVILKSNK